MIKDSLTVFNININIGKFPVKKERKIRLFKSSSKIVKSWNRLTATTDGISLFIKEKKKRREKRETIRRAGCVPNTALVRPAKVLTTPLGHFRPLYNVSAGESFGAINPFPSATFSVK